MTFRIIYGTTSANMTHQLFFTRGNSFSNAEENNY